MVPFINILEKVATAYGVSAEEIKTRRRTEELAGARQLVAYFLRKINTLSYPVIGEMIERDHTTAIHAYEKVSRRIESDSAFRNFIDNLNDALLKLDTESGPGDPSAMTTVEIRHLREKTTKKMPKKMKNTPEGILVSIRNANRSANISDREALILAQYRSGMTLAEVGAVHKVSRERIRQIVMIATMKELAEKTGGVAGSDLSEYLRSEKRLHNRRRNPWRKS